MTTAQLATSLHGEMMKRLLLVLAFVPTVAYAQAPPIPQPATQAQVTPAQVCQQIAGNQIGQISELAAQLQNANATIQRLSTELAAAKGKK